MQRNWLTSKWNGETKASKVSVEWLPEYRLNYQHEIIWWPCGKVTCHAERYTWPALPKPATYAHHVNEQFSPSMDSSINKLTNCQYTTAKCWQVCFCWGLFLRSVRRPRVLGCPLDATGIGLYRQPPCWKSGTIRLVDDIDHGFSYVLWQFECNGASLWAISPWKMQSSAVTRHFVATPHPPPSTLHPYMSACGVDNKTI